MLYAFSPVQPSNPIPMGAPHSTLKQRMLAGTPTFDGSARRHHSSVVGELERIKLRLLNEHVRVTVYSDSTASVKPKPKPCAVRSHGLQCFAANCSDAGGDASARRP